MDDTLVYGLNGSLRHCSGKCEKLPFENRQWLHELNGVWCLIGEWAASHRRAKHPDEGVHGGTSIVDSRIPIIRFIPDFENKI